MDLAFIAIPVLLAGVLIWATAAAWRRSGATAEATRRAAIVIAIRAAAWMALTWTAAESGLLRRWDQMPPPFALLILGVLALACLIAFSELGRRLAEFLPLWALVAVQAFRLPLELAMHELAERGIMPIQMTYTGRNFDIITGITALVVAGAVASGRGGRGLVGAWNVMGLALLINVIIVAILATPVFRYFGEDHLNVFVTYTPYVWLPAVMVLAALAGHLVIFRALRTQPR
jgi:hypothetical protein